MSCPIAPSADVREWFFPGIRREFLAGETDRLRKELGIDPGSGVVLYTGNFEPYQGVERLLDAALGVVAEVPGTIFVLVGDETPSRFCRSKSAALLREQGALRLVPRQPKSKINCFMAIADVLVSPRDDIGNIGIKIFEYMGAGKPIVATDTPSHRAVLDETRAILVDLSPEAMEARSSGSCGIRRRETPRGFRPVVCGEKSWLENVRGRRRGPVRSGKKVTSNRQVPGDAPPFPLSPW